MEKCFNSRRAAPLMSSAYPPPSRIPIWWVFRAHSSVYGEYVKREHCTVCGTNVPTYDPYKAKQPQQATRLLILYTIRQYLLMHICIFDICLKK